MSDVQFTAATVNKSVLSTADITNGCVYFVADAGELFYDIRDTRVQITDIVILPTEADRTSSLFTPSNKFYFVVETNILWRFEGDAWNMVSSSDFLKLENLPTVNGNVIGGELTDLGVALVTDIPTKVSELENDANYMKELIAGDGIVIQGDTISSTGAEVGYDSATRTLIFSAPTNMVTAESIMDEIIGE